MKKVTPTWNVASMAPEHLEGSVSVRPESNWKCLKDVNCVHKIRILNNHTFRSHTVPVYAINVVMFYF